MALIALLLGLHSTAHLAALAAYDPRHRPPPRDPAEVEQELDRVLASLSRSPHPGSLHRRAGCLLLVKGERLRELGDTDGARRSYREAVSRFLASLEANPLDAPTHWEIALALERLEERDKADFYADRGVRLSPSHADLQYKLGDFFFERRAFKRVEGRWTLDEEGLKKAFACFRRASEADPSYFNRSLERVEKSIPHLKDFAPLVPDTLEGRRRYAGFLARRKRWKEAADLEEELIASGEDHPEGRIRAGVARMREGRIRDARAHFGEAVRRWQLSPSQVRTISRVFEQTGNATAGTEFFLSLARLEPEEVIPVTKALGTLFLKLERFKEAEEYFTKAAVEGQDSEAYYRLGVLAEMSGDLYNAERNLKQAIRGNRDIPRYHRELGRIFEKTGHMAEALREMEIACRMAPDNQAWLRDLKRVKERWREGK